MVTEKLCSEIMACRRLVGEKINQRMVNQFELILAVAAMMMLFRKVQKVAGSTKGSLIFSGKDYSCSYGWHSTGPFFTLKDPGRKKLLALGLTEGELLELTDGDYYRYDNFDTRPLRLLLEDRKGKGAKLAAALLDEQLKQSLKDWRDWQEKSPHLKSSADFLIGLMPEKLGRSIFSYS